MLDVRKFHCLRDGNPVLLLKPPKEGRQIRSASLLHELRDGEIKGNLNLLGNQRNAFGQLTRLIFPDRTAPQQDLSIARRKKAAKNLKECRLPCSVCSNNSDCLSCTYIKAQVIQYRFCRVGERHSMRSQKVLHTTYSCFERR